MNALAEKIAETIRANADDLRRRGISHIALFGSVARGEARADSDVDFAVDLDPDARISLIGLEGLRRHLEELLGRSVDIGTRRSLKTYFKAEFDREHVEIF